MTGSIEAFYRPFYTMVEAVGAPSRVAVVRTIPSQNNVSKVQRSARDRIVLS